MVRPIQLERSYSVLEYRQAENKMFYFHSDPNLETINHHADFRALEQPAPITDKATQHILFLLVCMLYN